MGEESFLKLAMILALGALGLTAAHLLRFPAIIILLLLGLVLGPFTGLLNPDALFGDFFLPAVSLGVAVILFEGGLSLHLHEATQTRKAVFSLITIGVAVTTLAIGALAHSLFDLPLSVALLLGAIASVSGPTVVTPLLRQVRLRAPLGAILRWEGILVDPVGVVLAVLLFEGIVTQDLSPLSVGGGMFYALLVGTVIGGIAGTLVVFLFDRYVLAEHLHAPVTLALLLLSFALANFLAHESGLLAAIVMGAVIINRSRTSIRHIIELAETLRDVSIAVLFIVLAARLELADLTSLGWESLVFLGLLIFVIRPLAVFLSTLGSGLSLRERLFIGALAPRGIVAASMSALLALELTSAGVPYGEQLVSLTFVIILGTVVFYGLSAAPVSAALGVREKEPQGVLFVGAHRAARILAEVLSREGLRTLLIDTNPTNIAAARRRGLEAFPGSAVSERTLEQLDLNGIGRLIALTSNDEANSLATVEFMEVFGRREVYQLAPEIKMAETTAGEHPVRPRGRIAFSEELRYETLLARIRDRSSLEVLEPKDEKELEAVQQHIANGAILLFLLDAKGSLIIPSNDVTPTVKSGHKVFLLPPAAPMATT